MCSSQRVFYGFVLARVIGCTAHERKARKLTEIDDKNV